jgi:tetratricopeptide (TPR) repeat protein
LTLARTVHNWQAECRALTNIGSGYASLGLTLIDIDESRATSTFHEALSHFQHVLQLAESHQDADLVGKTYGHLGNIYDHLSDFDKATKHHLLRIKQASDRGDAAAEGRAWCNLGNSYRAQGLVDKAIDCYLRDLRICSELKDRNGEGITSCNLAHAYQAQGDFRNTKLYFERFIAITTTTGDKHGMLNGYRSLARVYQAVGQYDNALSCLQAQLNVAQDLQDATEIKEIGETLALVQKLQVQGHTVSQEDAIAALVIALEEAENRVPLTQKRYP